MPNMQWNNEDIDAMQTHRRYENIYRGIHFHRRRIYELGFQDPFNFGVQQEIHYNRLLEEKLWHDMCVQQIKEARHAAVQNSMSVRNSSFACPVNADLRVQEGAGIFGSSKPQWDEKIASKDYTDFEHRGVAVKQLSDFEDGFIRAPEGKKLIAVRIVKVDTTTKMATILKVDSTLVGMFDEPSEIEANKVLYRCTRDPRSILLSSDVVRELSKREEYMTFEDIIEGIKKPTKWFRREDPCRLNSSGVESGLEEVELVKNFLDVFAFKVETHKFCKTIFNLAAKKSINSLDAAAKQIPDVSLDRVFVTVKDNKVTYMAVRVHAKTDKVDESYDVIPENANWKCLLFHIKDTAWNKPGPEDMATLAKKADEIASQRASIKGGQELERARKEKAHLEREKGKKAEQAANRKFLEAHKKLRS